MFEAFMKFKKSEFDQLVETMNIDENEASQNHVDNMTQYDLTKSKIRNEMESLQQKMDTFTVAQDEMSMQNDQKKSLISKYYENVQTSEKYELEVIDLQAHFVELQTKIDLLQNQRLDPLKVTTTHVSCDESSGIDAGNEDSVDLPTKSLLDEWHKWLIDVEKRLNISLT